MKMLIRGTRLITFIISALAIYSLLVSLQQYATGKCSKGIYSEYALVISYDEPYYKENKMIKYLYEKVFGRVIICGPEPDAHSGRFTPDIEFETDRGKYGYNCMVLAINKYENHSGYFYASNDLVLNWWNFHQLNFSKIWVFQTRPQQIVETSLDSSDKKMCENYKIFLQRVGKVQGPFKNLKENYHQNQVNPDCTMERPSRFFYLPGRVARDFSMLGGGAYVNRLKQDLALPNVMQSLDHSNNYEQIEENFILPRRKSPISPELWTAYNTEMLLTHPFKMYNKNKTIWRYNKRRFKNNFGDVSLHQTHC